MLNVDKKVIALLAICTMLNIPMVLADTVPANGELSNPNDLMPDVVGTTQSLVIPSLQLTRQDGSQANFPEELNDGKPVVLTFVFTSCKTVCPIMSHIMKNIQNALGDRAKQIRMASISLDPEYDTPERLTEYAHKLGAGEQWMHYTGRNEDIVKLERAFNIYRGDKMNHLTVFFARRSPEDSWTRFIGFVKSDRIIDVIGLGQAQN